MTQHIIFKDKLLHVHSAKQSSLLCLYSEWVQKKPTTKQKQNGLLKPFCPKLIIDEYTLSQFNYWWIHWVYLASNFIDCWVSKLMDSHKHLKNDCSEYQDLLHHKHNALSGPSAKGDLGKKRKKKKKENLHLERLIISQPVKRQWNQKPTFRSSAEFGWVGREVEGRSLTPSIVPHCPPPPLAFLKLRKNKQAWLYIAQKNNFFKKLHLSCRKKSKSRHPELALAP